MEHPEAVSLQLSCAGDIQNRIFVAQSLGYFPDLNGYYTKPRSLLKIDELRGTVAEVVQQMKILLTVA